MWVYRIRNNTWTWIGGSNSSVNVPAVYGTKGVSGASNHPGSRVGAVGWYDSSARALWLFGGEDQFYGTWDCSYSRLPSRKLENCQILVHTFLSTALTAGYLQDLWVYHLSNSTWTWVGGRPESNIEGAYGTRGVPSVSNYPGARLGSVVWYDDSAQELWLFGGTCL